MSVLLFGSEPDLSYLEPAVNSGSQGGAKTATLDKEGVPYYLASWAGYASFSSCTELYSAAPPRTLSAACQFGPCGFDVALSDIRNHQLRAGDMHNNNTA